MSRHRSTPMSMLVAALALATGSSPASSRADSLTPSSSNPLSVTADYTLTATSTLPAPTGPPPGTPDVTLTGTLTSGSPNVVVPYTGGLAVGYGVSGAGVPTGTTISQLSQINSSAEQVTLSQNVSASGSQSLVFTPNVAPPQVVAQVVPVGGVYTPPSTSTVGPLTVLPSSQGLSSHAVYDSLVNTTNSSGQPDQYLGLSFYGQGLLSKAAGGMLNFSLAITNANSPPQLQSLTPGVSITLDSTSSSTTSSPTSTSSPIVDAQLPEPLSVLLWSVLAGAGVIRVHASRRSCSKA